jgi:hypothetical protein
MADMLECPRCGGQGGCPGSDFGDYGWHPCFACGESGVVTSAVAESIAVSDAKLAQDMERERRYSEGDWGYDGPDPDTPNEVGGYADFPADYRACDAESEALPF